MGAAWFRRMGDIPGLDYSPPVSVDRAALPRHDEEPEVDSYTLEGRETALVMWGMRPIAEHPSGEAAWESMGSPAVEHLRDVASTETDYPTEQVLGRLREALELPGTPEDYHYALGAVCQKPLTRKLAPDVLEAVESLAWLDIRLLQTHPDTHIIKTYEGKRAIVSNNGFDTLIAMYREEGFLHDASSVADLRHRLADDNPYVTNLQARVEAIRSEGAASR
jgi:hypothetical protein